MSKIIENIIDNILDGDFTGANAEFGGAMAEKIDTALEQEKILVSGEIYNGIGREELYDEFDLDEDEEHGYKVKSKGDKFCIVDAKTGEEYGDTKYDSKEDAKAAIKGMKEDVEDLDELSRKTLGSYVKKSARSVRNAGIGFGVVPYKSPNAKKYGKKMDKREKGISTATDKLTREEYLDVKEVE